MSINTSKKMYSAPPTNRGVDNTLNNDFDIENKGITQFQKNVRSLEVNLVQNELIIDWFQATIFPPKDYMQNYKFMYDNFIWDDRIIPILFNELFNISSNDIIKETTGFNGYDINYSYRDIYIMLNSTRYDMGINILMRGQGCRDFEELGIRWNELFNKLTTFDINFNRIDIAIDTFNENSYFDIPLLLQYVDNNLCVSKFRNSLRLIKNSLSNTLPLGETLQFGSKASDIEITFYNKSLEREYQGYIVDNNITSWVRTELRFRHEKAKDVFNLINTNEDYSTVIYSILYNYIDFKSSKSKDTNISRRATVKWWSDFLSNCKKLKLTSRSSERRLTKKYNWLLSNTSKTQLMVYMAGLSNIKLDTLSIDLLYELLIKGSEKIKDKDIELINDSRIKNKLVPITKEQILDYIQDMKDNILI